MRKTILHPGGGSVPLSDEIDEVISARAQAVHHPDHARVYVSGTAWTSGDLAEQLEKIFGNFEELLAEEFDAELRSVVRLRHFVREPLLTPENRTLVHEKRAQFFERPHYPASTFAEVSGLAHEEAKIEIDAEAVVPEDEWETTVAGE